MPVPVVSLRSHRSAGWAGDGEEVGRHGNGTAWRAAWRSVHRSCSRAKLHRRARPSQSSVSVSVRTRNREHPPTAVFPLSRLAVRPTEFQDYAIVSVFSSSIRIQFSPSCFSQGSSEKAILSRYQCVFTIVSRDFSRTFVLVEIFTGV